MITHTDHAKAKKNRAKATNFLMVYSVLKGLLVPSNVNIRKVILR